MSEDKLLDAAVVAAKNADRTDMPAFDSYMSAVFDLWSERNNTPKLVGAFVECEDKSRARDLLYENMRMMFLMALALGMAAGMKALGEELG